MISVYSFILYAHTLYACALFFLFYTFIGSLSDDPEFTRPNIRYFMLLIRCSLRSYMLRGAEVSTYSGIIAFLYSCYYFLILVSYLVSIPFFISSEITCRHYMYYCSDVVSSWWLYNLVRLFYA